MTTSSPAETAPRGPLDSWISSWISLDSWAVIGATLVVLVIVLGITPHVPW
jgi:hypothetical protein